MDENTKKDYLLKLYIFLTSLGGLITSLSLILDAPPAWLKDAQKLYDDVSADYRAVKKS